MSHDGASRAADDRDLRRGVAWNVASIATLALAGIGLNVLIGRCYGPADLGVFNQVLCAYVLFSMAAAGGINYSLLRAVAEAPREHARVAGAVVGGLVPTLVLAAVVTTVFYLVRHAVGDLLDSPAVATGMGVAAPGLFFFALNKQLLAVVNGLGRMRAFAVYQALRNVLILIGLWIGWRLEVSGPELSFVWSFAEGTLFLFLALEVGLQVRWREARDVLAWSRDHVAYGVRSVLSAMLLELNARVDVWMLGIWLDDVRVGVYSLAANLAEGFFQLVVALQSNFNPRMANSLARGAAGEVEELVSRSRRWIVPSFAAAALASVLVYPYVLPVLGKGGEFADSWRSFAILVGAIGLLGAWLPFGNLLLMAKRPGWHTALMLWAAGVNVLGNALLIPRWGIHGAAAGTAIAFVAFVTLLRVLARRQAGVRL